METSIRYVIWDGIKKPALCFRGRKSCHAVLNDNTRIRVVSSLSLKDHDLSYPVTFKSGPYPIPKVVEHFRKIGGRKGITKRAEFFLERALNGGVTDDDALPPDEVDPGQSLEEAAVAIERGLAGSAERPPHVPGRPKGAPGRSPAAPKPEKAASKTGKPGAAGSRTAGAAVIVRIAAELKLEPTKLRKLLRSKGLSAPYDDEAKIRKALGK